LAPDNYFVENAHLKFFGYSSIYTYSWQQLQNGYFAYNLGGKLLGFRNWMVLLPNLLSILAVTAIFVIAEKHQGKMDLSPK
jgi:hypothetical protein